jgi:prolyl oligopeptidase
MLTSPLVAAKGQPEIGQRLERLIIKEMANEAVTMYQYPVARRAKVVEDYHGIKVADPYRWLEDPDSSETVAWVEAQNELTFSFLRNIPAREQVKARLTALWNYPKYSAPSKEGQRYFFSKNDGLQNQAVLYRQETLDSEPVSVLDPNKLSEDGTAALTNQVFNRDGTLLAYGISRSGSDRQEIKVRQIDRDEDYPEVIKWCKFAGIGWKRDSSGFFYNRYPEPGTVSSEDLINYNTVYWHQLGTFQADDKLVYEYPEDKELAFVPSTTEDGKYVLLTVWRGTEPQNGIYYREVEDQNGAFVHLLENNEARYDFIDNSGPVFYFQTNLNAPKGRVIAIDVTNPARENWKEIIPEQPDVLSFVTMVNDKFVTGYLHDVHHVIKVFSEAGEFEREIELPTLGSIIQLTGKREDSEMFIAFASFLYPTTILRYDFTKNELTTFRQPELDFDPSGYETEQVFFHSKDGTRVPMFLTHKKGLVLDGNNPTVLYGYGGFDISLAPSFALNKLVWLEHGGIYAVANLRGGGEYGEAWHEAGILERKQNVFDDFIAAAEWLIENKYTSTPKLAIEGGSNGGLLTAACLTQRPDLYGAVLCHVPVIDMLRYHRFTVGRYWTTDYGNADASLKDFRFMFAYSPLHNVRVGVVYPPTLITSADTDDRVVPAHAKKFAATLQSVAVGDNPLLLRVETKAGHGLGKPTSKLIDELSDVYAFLFEILKVR